MEESHFPLRWESTGDQWWYATPIDWAAASGHYDVVRELLHQDANLLIKLTSLRRIRRLESVWDDDMSFANAAKNRAAVARCLLLDCESRGRANRLIRAGYGGWLLYTAAAAGDAGFVQELLGRQPLLVFGEGEYGVTDILYAAARSRSSEVFRMLLHAVLSPACSAREDGGEVAEESGNGGAANGGGYMFKREMMNRAMHAAARGGNLEVLRELLQGCSDASAFRDAQGSTILHAASARGQVEVVNDLIASFDIVNSIDEQGNTALHIAAFRGHLPVVEVLITASPSLISASNEVGLDSSLQVLERSHTNLTEHHVESNSPTSTHPEMLSDSGPTEALKHSMEDNADHSSSADAIEVDHMSVHVSTGDGTMPTDEMKSKEDKICCQTNIAVKPKVIEDSETKPESPYRGLVDTAAPFESVREAVTKFGGIVDWKAHKVQMMERRKLIHLELEKVKKDIPQCKEELEAAEMSKSQVVDELETTKRIIEELKHDLEKAQIEEVQAKQDSELAQLRAQEIEQGVADEASVIARTQMEVAKERHEKAVAELNSVKEELRTLHEQYVILVNERETAIRRAEEVISAGKEIEKRVEELTLELIASKGSLELAHAAHHEAEEHRIGAALAKEQDRLSWDRELQQAQDELQQLNNKLLSKNDVKQNLDANLRKLHSLKFGLSAYVEKILSEEAEGVAKEHESEDAGQISKSITIKGTLASTQKELEEVKGNIQKAKNEANLLRVAATTLRSEMDNEKDSLITLQQREGMASIAVSSLEAELDRTKQEIESVRTKEADAQAIMVELPKMLQQAAQEAEDAKVAAHSAQEGLRKAKEEAEQTKAAATTADIRLYAVRKETEASKASERLAMAAVQALQESEEARDVEDSPRGVTLPLSEYYALSKKAHEAEELANERVTAALAQVESAKGPESKSLDKLNEASKEMDEKKEALEIALERAERANEGKLAAEQELRKWRADHEQHRRAHEATKHAVNPLSSPPRRFVEQKAPYHKEQESKLQMSGSSYEDLVPNRKLRRKKSFFPLMGSLLSRKTQAQT